jgi:hypothetical protein
MLSADSLPVDEVGAWAKDKHDRLRKYVDISRAARRKFVEGSGGATYIDEPLSVRPARRSTVVRLLPLNVRGKAAFHFRTYKALSRSKRIDMLIHVSAQDLQRNLDAYSMSTDGPLDHFAPGWRDVVDLKQSQGATRTEFIKYWVARMEALGLPPARFELVSGTTKNQRLYWLVFVSRSDFAKSVWDKIRNVSGQGELL